MPRFHVHFAADPAEPMPLVEELPSIDADDPLAAVEEMLAQGRVPQNRLLRWARVVVSVHENRRPRQVVRVPIVVDEVIPIDAPRRLDEQSDYDRPAFFTIAIT